MKISANQCPANASPEQYLEHVRRALLDARIPVDPPPWSGLEALHDRHPKIAARFMPAREHLDRAEFPSGWPKAAEPYNEGEQERLLETLATDKRFRNSARHYLGVA